MSVAKERQTDTTPSLVEGIVSAVADTKGIDTADVSPLYNVIDPDALNTLFQQGTDGRVVFEFEGCKVTVSAPDEIDVARLE